MNLETIVNEKSLTFVNKWLAGCKMIDLRNLGGEECNWVYLLYQEKGSEIIRVASLAKRGTGCDPTFFGTLSHMVKCMASDAIPGGNPNDIFKKTIEIEKHFIRLYNLPEKYFWSKAH